MPQPQTQEVYRQGLGGMDAWTRHQHFIENYVKFYNNDKPSSTREPGPITERDILHENHRFLRSESDDQDLTWEKRIAKKYYDKLFKEYALVELKYYKEGRVAMRWRNEKEVVRGKGQFICGNLRCNESQGLESWEVNFGYVEQGEKKNALVKIRLCEKCSYRLNYRSTHKRANLSREDESASTSAAPATATIAAAAEPSKKRSRSSSRDRAAGGKASEPSQNHNSRYHESSTRSEQRSRTHSRELDRDAFISDTTRRDHQGSSKRRKSSSRRDEDKADSKDRVTQSERSRSPLHRDHRRSRSTSDGHDKQDSREGRSHGRSKSAGERERSRRSDVDGKKRGENYDRAKETIDSDKVVDHRSTIDKGGDKRDSGKSEDSSTKPSSITEFDRFFKGLFE
ncbi:hypothetical protein EC957_009467 [Mortierella hygrophila]|uniref:Protein FRA10AC1 n=1 Tax=Mortierella hygrophila TaxID=979708 RepID=A0A9P6K517_9FUNG|nr:hypothetical protein EC957_009467 [Mortierella hygrophila]